MGRVAWTSAISPLAVAASKIELPPEPMPVTSLLDRFADELAEHGDIARAATVIRVADGVGRDLFATICRRLGQQAT